LSIKGLWRVQRNLDRLMTLSHERLLRLRVRRKDFSVVASNCWGGELYKELGLAYTSPFVGLYLYAPCYVRLLSDFRRTLMHPVEFGPPSRYIGVTPYPLGFLNGDIELHFVHYVSREEAQAKWERRLARMQWNVDRIFFMFSDRDLCDESHIRAFGNLDFPHKVCFTARPYPDVACSVWMAPSAGQSFVEPGDRLYRDCKSQFDVAGWLNGGSGTPGPLHRLGTRLYGNRKS
jgi:uncharacterized protein (DUF1919 family)